MRIKKLKYRFKRGDIIKTFAGCRVRTVGKKLPEWTAKIISRTIWANYYLAYWVRKDDGKKVIVLDHNIYYAQCPHCKRRLN